VKLEPIYRKVIIPWYDGDKACFLVIIFMIFVLLFGAAGVFVARENPEYQDHIGIPLALIIMSGLVILSTVIRLIKRYIGRFKNDNTF
jgi:hypothetical protein